MHTEYRHIINTDPKHPKHGDKDHIVSYYGINIITNTHTPTHTHMFINICILQYMGDIASFFSSLQFLLSCFSVKTQCTRLLEIISYLVSPRAGTFAQVVVYVALIGLSTVQVSFEERWRIFNPNINCFTYKYITQIISTSSNSYILDDNWSKRDWTLLWGGIFMFMLLIPSFRHYRMMSVLGIVSTTYTGDFPVHIFWQWRMGGCVVAGGWKDLHFYWFVHYFTSPKYIVY